MILEKVLTYLGLRSILSWLSMSSRMVYFVFFLILVLFLSERNNEKLSSDLRKVTESKI